MTLLGDTLVHSLPWYFGVTVFALWGGATTAMVLLVRRRVKARAERRPISRSARTERDDHALGPGADVEPCRAKEP